jgi:hypothetical protein
MSSKASGPKHLTAPRPSKGILRNPASPLRRPRKRLKAFGKVNFPAGHILVTPSEIRKEAESLRELLLWDLREQGYRLREIAGVLGITRQRVNQIETRMIRRAVISKISSTTPRPPRIVWKSNASYVRLVTFDEFERRLNALNAFYEARFKRILNRLNKRQRGKMVESHRSSLFCRVWPYIERYKDEPFNFSKLIADFPVLAREPYLSQLLSRLRREGVLRKVGSVRIESHNLPEVLMARTALVESVSTQIEKLTAVWGRKLRELEASYQSIRPNQTLRDHIREILHRQDRARFEFEKTLGLPRADLIPTGPFMHSAGGAESRSEVPSLGSG